MSPQFVTCVTRLHVTRIKHVTCRYGNFRHRVSVRAVSPTPRRAAPGDHRGGNFNLGKILTTPDVISVYTKRETTSRRLGGEAGRFEIFESLNKTK